MPEQFRIQQGLRQCGAIDLHERSVPALGQEVKAFSDQLLAGSPLPDDKDGAIQRGDAGDMLLRAEPCRGLAQQLCILINHLVKITKSGD